MQCSFYISTYILSTVVILVLLIDANEPQIEVSEYQEIPDDLVERLSSEYTVSKHKYNAL